MKPLWLMLSLLVAGLWVPSPAMATDRWFADVEAVSQNGRFRFTAKSPDNATEKPRAFQSNFKYELVDTASGKVLWTRGQKHEYEPAPVNAWVTDEGGVIVETSWSEFNVFGADSPKPKASHNFLELLPKADSEKFVHQTTAGSMWTQGRLVYLADHDGVSLLVVRAWWGWRLVIDIASGKRVLEDAPLSKFLREKEHQVVIDMLHRAVAEFEKHRKTCFDEKDWKSYFGAIDAARIAGMEGVKEAVPMLRALEQCDRIDSSCSGGQWSLRDFPKGSINPSNWEGFNIRTAIQTALRRLGEKPAPLPITQFRFVNDGAKRARVVPIELKRPRAEMVGEVKAGMSPLEVLQTIGAPDFVPDVGRACTWEYDMDADPPYTFVVTWSQELPPTLVEVERVMPPRWADPLGPRTEW